MDPSAKERRKWGNKTNMRGGRWANGEKKRKMHTMHAIPNSFTHKQRQILRVHRCSIGCRLIDCEAKTHYIMLEKKIKNTRQVARQGGSPVQEATSVRPLSEHIPPMLILEKIIISEISKS